MASNSEWTPSSWKSKSAAQSVNYPDEEHFERVLNRVSTLPPLVSPGEIERLRFQLAGVQRGEAFLLHAGDCAESFDACTYENISAKLGLILSFSLILVWGARLPVVRIGRIAGQYAKPRSSATEIVNGKEVMSFRGDNVNSLDPDRRQPDPERLLSAYFHSTATLNSLRSLLSSGFASLHHPRDWSLSHVRSPILKDEFERLTSGLADALAFSNTIGVDSGREALPFEQSGKPGVLGEVDLYTSHEGLMLGYEEALTRLLPFPTSVRNSVKDATRKDTIKIKDNIPHAYYNTSAHFIWIGDRTRQLDGAHVEYFRGIRNPIGIKVGPSMKGDELVNLLDIVNPDRESGRVTLITRYGAAKVEEHLPVHIAAVQKSGHPVAWICDPMHGNTQTSCSGLKTRHFGSIVSEVTTCMRVHAENGSSLGGVSLEFTGEFNEEGFSVTECLGGSMELSEDQLELRYQSFCDPRLNFEQSLDLAFLISNHFKKQRAGAQLDSTQPDALLAEFLKRK